MTEVAPAVRRKLLALGPVGRQWLGDLKAVVGSLAAKWDLRLGEPVIGGSASYVIHAKTSAGVDCVLKVAIPPGLSDPGDFDNELLTLRLGGADAYVEVLEVDHERRAVLLERLGRPLTECGLTVEAQLVVLGATIARGWRNVSMSIPLKTGADQARDLGEYIEQKWHELDQPCPQRTVERALEYTRNRRAAFDRTKAVLIHADPHPANLLEESAANGLPGRFKMVDPEGGLSEPAHDLGIALRGWPEELLSGDPVGLGRSWCAIISELTGVDERAIWEWAFIERLSTGLFLRDLGDEAGAGFLEVAAHWTNADL